VADHVAQVQQSDFLDGFVAWLDKCQVARTFDGEGRHSPR
jgi:hypothetical protein